MEENNNNNIENNENTGAEENAYTGEGKTSEEDPLSYIHKYYDGRPDGPDLDAHLEYEDNHDPKASILCICSIILLVLAHLSIFLFTWWLDLGIFPPIGLFFIAGFILAIIAKVKFPKNKTAKVLIIIYIIELVIVGGLYLWLMITCGSACNTCDTCIYDCSGCGNIG